MVAVRPLGSGRSCLVWGRWHAVGRRGAVLAGVRARLTPEGGLARADPPFCIALTASGRLALVKFRGQAVQTYIPSAYLKLFECFCLE